MKVTTSTGDGSTLLTIHLWRDESPEESNEILLGEQLAAMQDFAQGWIEPLAIEAEIVCCDPAGVHSSHGLAHPPVRVWMLRTRVSNVAMEPTVTGARVDECDRIVAATIKAHVHRALSQPCGTAQVAGLETLGWEAIRVKLPSSGVSTFVVVDVDLTIPIEKRGDGDWVSGPRSGALTGSPFWFSLSEGALRFDVHWAFWLKGGGREQVDAAVARVLARNTGWYVAHPRTT